MVGFPNFRKVWASQAAIAEPTDTQKASGFQFLGNTPPSFELFNAIQQDNDTKLNWIFYLLERVMTDGGVTPADVAPGGPGTAGHDQLSRALFNRFGGIVSYPGPEI